MNDNTDCVQKDALEKTTEGNTLPCSPRLSLGDQMMPTICFLLSTLFHLLEDVAMGKLEMASL